MKILVTGGAGFIGSALVRFLINETDCEVLNLDKLTYAGHLESLKSVNEHPRYRFVQADICDSITVTKILMDFVPDKIIHLAAESHVDRSVDAPAEFVQTNIIGAQNMATVLSRMSQHGKQRISAKTYAPQGYTLFNHSVDIHSHTNISTSFQDFKNFSLGFVLNSL